MLSCWSGCCCCWLQGLLCGSRVHSNHLHPKLRTKRPKVLKSDEADLRAEDEAALTDDATEWTHGEPIQWDQVDRLPRLVYRVRPEYPEALREQGVHSTVRVRLTIDTAGRVERAEILDSPEGAFEDPAVAAAQQFVFDPATRNGVPVSFVLETSIEFNPFR
ncbi:MAG: energy transducer TonB [Verrucomicrobia bacterium]|nr:energy transducer TonB [Verrucomicrobiota bacterium]